MRERATEQNTKDDSIEIYNDTTTCGTFGFRSSGEGRQEEVFRNFFFTPPGGSSIKLYCDYHVQRCRKS